MELYNYLITNDREKIIEYADKLNNTLENHSIDVSIIPTERIIVGEHKEFKRVVNKIRKPKQFNLRASNNENKKLNGEFNIIRTPTERIIIAGELRGVKKVGNESKKPKKSNSQASKENNKQINYGDFKRKVDRCEQRFRGMGNIAGAISNAIQIVLVVFKLPEIALCVEFAKYLIQAYIDMTSK